jgi:hypothetical protein
LRAGEVDEQRHQENIHLLGKNAFVCADRAAKRHSDL